MDDDRPRNRLFGLPLGPLQGLVDRMRAAVPGHDPGGAPDLLTAEAARVPEKFYRLDQRDDYLELVRAGYLLEKLGIEVPYFRCHDGLARDTTSIDGTECLNFATYNYLDLNGHPEVSGAAKAAIDRYGTSASASRITSGDKRIHRELEAAVSGFLGVEACHVFVSGHATNVTSIGTLLGAKDLIVHDALIHNSVTQGALLSGAHRMAFPHNDAEALDRILREVRGRYERVLVVVEGLYSMDGDLPPLPRLLELRARHRFMLMVDEAHSLGVVGERGGGVREHFGVDPGSVDVWMGTFSKALAGCGGYIAGSKALVELMRYRAPGSVYSVGMSPALAASSLAALGVLRREPERVAALRRNTRRFLELARGAGLDTGRAEGHAIVPVILGASAKAVGVANRLFARKINAVPIVAPAVEERSARLRFFLSAAHREEQLEKAVRAVAEEVGS